MANLDMQALSVVARLLAGAGIGLLVAGIVQDRPGVWLPGVAFLTVGVTDHMFFVLRKRG
jgi:hypothetical protein